MSASEDSQEDIGSQDLFADANSETIDNKQILNMLKKMDSKLNTMQSELSSLKSSMTVNRVFNIETCSFKKRMNSFIKSRFSQFPWLNAQTDIQYKNEVKKCLKNEGFAGDPHAYKNVVMWSSSRYTDFRNQLRRRIIQLLQSRDLQILDIEEICRLFVGTYCSGGEDPNTEERQRLCLLLRSFLYKKKMFSGVATDGGKEVATDFWPSFREYYNEKHGQNADITVMKQIDIKRVQKRKEIMGKKETETDEENKGILKPIFTQHLPANGKSMLIADVDGDGQTEIVVAYSDRVVRCFRWTQMGTGDVLDTGSSSGNLIQISQWQLGGQIGSLTVNISEEGKPELLVAQPGGTYVKLFLTSSSGADSPTQSDATFVEERLGSARIRNNQITTEIVGGINKGHRSKAGGGTFYALCTLDGTLILIENKEILWSLQVDHQLFASTKLDVTGNGTEEVVCCGWDGQTYIVNHTRDVVRYQFEENVTAFTAGQYAVNKTDNVPCFVYATFNNKIYIYYNISLPRVESTNLIEVMDKMDKTHELLAKLNITDPDTSQLKELYHWLLYGWKPDSQETT